MLQWAHKTLFALENIPTHCSSTPTHALPAGLLSGPARCVTTAHSASYIHVGALAIHWQCSPQRFCKVNWYAPRCNRPTRHSPAGTAPKEHTHHMIRTVKLKHRLTFLTQQGSVDIPPQVTPLPQSETATATSRTGPHQCRHAVTPPARHATEMPLMHAQARADPKRHIQSGTHACCGHSHRPLKMQCSCLHAQTLAIAPSSTMRPTIPPPPLIRKAFRS
jgi:hypothetical protein